MAIPAVPPARIIALRLSSEGDAPAGVRAFFVTSYAAKYLFVIRSELATLFWKSNEHTQHFLVRHELM